MALRAGEGNGDRLISLTRGNCFQLRLVKIEVLAPPSSTPDLANVSHHVGPFVSESRHAGRERSIFHRVARPGQPVVRQRVMRRERAWAARARAMLFRVSRKCVHDRVAFRLSN